jgi:hypothetical protein
MKFYKIITNNEKKWVTNINEEDICEVVYQDELKYIPRNTADELGAEDDDLISDFDLYDVYEYATVLTEGVIDLDSLDDKALYFDSWCDRFYTADKIRDWDTTKVIHNHDGSNYRTEEIFAEAELDDDKLVKLDYIQSGTGSIEIYEYEGKKIKIEYSYYQGSYVTVEIGEDILDLLS